MKKLTGVWTAMITPFSEQGKLDRQGLKNLLQRQLQSRINGIVALGTTGETPTLSTDEKIEIVQICREVLADKVPFMVGTGSNSTEETVKNSIAAVEAGASAVLIITPYYNNPSQEGIYRHFKEVSHAVNVPIMVYNHPGRTGQNIKIETLKRLAELPNIVGIKEVSGSVAFTQKVLKELPNWTVMSGDDPLTLPVMALGGDGIISVASNLIPDKIITLVEAMSNGELEWARHLHFELLPLFESLSLEVNPVPIKTLMNLGHLPAGPCRLPLAPPPEKTLSTLKTLMHQYGQQEPLHSTT